MRNTYKNLNYFIEKIDRKRGTYCKNCLASVRSFSREIEKLLTIDLFLQDDNALIISDNKSFETYERQESSPPAVPNKVHKAR